MTQDFRCGLDLGQASDYSALIIVERTGEGRESILTVRYAERWRGVAYNVLVAQVAKIIVKLGKNCRIRFNLDSTGVGRAVLDLFKQAHAEGELPVYPRAISITSGSEPSKDGTTAPKQDLIARVETLLATGRLKVAPALRLSPVIRQELASFKAKTSNTGHRSYEAGGTEHDDLIT